MLPCLRFRITPREKNYLRALADFGDGIHRSGDVADRLSISVQSAAPTRNALIMIYSLSHGDIAFTMPPVAEFMKRIMSE